MQRDGHPLGDPPDRRLTNTQSLALSTIVAFGPLRLWALAERMATIPIDPRRQKEVQLVRMMADDLPMIPVYYNPALIFARDGVTGVARGAIPNAAFQVNINTWDKTHDAEASQGWCPGVLDTNGDGRITPGWTEPNEPIDPTKDHRINFGAYSITVNP